MILAIDVGNTNIVLGCMEGQTVRSVSRIASDPGKTDCEYAVTIRDVLALRGVTAEELEGSVLSSVVRPLGEALSRAMELLTGKPPLVVGPGLDHGLEIMLDEPEQLGADLVVGAVAALRLCPPPLIVVDMGTATTLSVLDAAGRFRGGAIVPGLRLSMGSLSDGTNLLPRVPLEAPPTCIGTGTVSCMQSGAIYGSAAMLDGLIDRMEAELGQRVQVIATGGLAPFVTPYCRRAVRCEPELLLLGLAALWEQQK